MSFDSHHPDAKTMRGIRARPAQHTVPGPVLGPSGSRLDHAGALTYDVRTVAFLR